MSKLQIFIAGENLVSLVFALNAKPKIVIFFLEMFPNSFSEIT